MLTRAILFIGVVLGCAHAEGRDYLDRGWWGKPVDFEVNYQRRIQEILAPAFRPDVTMITMLLPPFDRETISGIRDTAVGPRAFWLEPTSQIWEAINDKKEELPKIRPRYREKAMSERLSRRIARLSETVLSDRDNYRKEKGTMYIDSSRFVFFVRGEHGPLVASTEHFDRGTKAFEVITTCDSIYKYVRGEITEGVLESRVAHSERKLGLGHTKASNQALELTSARTMSTFSMANPFSPHLTLAPRRP